VSGPAAKRIVDTNVAIMANRATDPELPEDLIDCAAACVNAISEITSNGGLVLDAGDEIFDEYRRNLSLSGQPGQGNLFMKWVHDNRQGLPDDDRVSITKDGDSYEEFPTHSGLANFDLSDRKFVAVANAHPVKPPILEATDSKWWGWKDALDEAGIVVIFLCEGWIAAKYKVKLGDAE